MTNKVDPITPEEALLNPGAGVPDIVIEHVNWMISQKMRGNSATIYQKDIVAELVSVGIPKEKIYENNWLDIEDLYRSRGWKVEYDKPGYNESGEAYFRFTAKGGRGSNGTR